MSRAEGSAEAASLGDLRLALLKLAVYGYPVENLRSLVDADEQRRQVQSQDKEKAEFLGRLAAKYRLGTAGSAPAPHLHDGSDVKLPPSEARGHGGSGDDAGQAAGSDKKEGGWCEEGGSDSCARELHALAKEVKMSADREEEYLSLYRCLHDAVGAILPEAKVVVVGSIASGIALNSSDCDLSVIAPGRKDTDVLLRQIHEEMDKRFRACGASEQQQPDGGGARGELQQSQAFKLKSQLIATARVPIVTLSTQRCRVRQAGSLACHGEEKKDARDDESEELEADVSANRSGGLHHCLLMR